jgi:hypothetical protein
MHLEGAACSATALLLLLAQQAADSHDAQQHPCCCYLLSRLLAVMMLSNSLAAATDAALQERDVPGYCIRSLSLRVCTQKTENPHSELVVVPKSLFAGGRASPVAGPERHRAVVGNNQALAGTTPTGSLRDTSSLLLLLLPSLLLLQG